MLLLITISIATFLISIVYCEKARLSHVIMPFHPRQLENVKDNLKLWSHYAPCNKDSTLQGIGFIFYVSSNKSTIANVEKFESELFESAETYMRCFKFFSIEYAGLSGDDNGYLLGSRLMFEKMIKKKINFGPNKPSHVFYMEPDCKPIRSGWLGALNNLIVEPNAPFWMKGSLFRGLDGIINHNNLYNRIHINGNAIYNLFDESFSNFFINVVRRVIKAKFHDNGAYDTDIFRVLLWRNAQYTAPFFHMFQWSDFIQNHWHSEYSLKEILENSPNTFFIHGGKSLD